MELQHRFISIQSVHKVIQAIIVNPGSADTHPKGTSEPSQLEKFWSFVISPSEITSSNAVNNITLLVQSGAISWNDALNKLTDSLSTLSGVQLDNVIIGITNILLYQVDTQTDSSLEYNCPFRVRGGMTHPYILIISTKTNESWSFLLTQIERIFDMSRLEFIKSKTPEKRSAFLRNILNMIHPFLDFIILDGVQGKFELQKYWTSTLVHFLIQIVYQNIDDKEFIELREHALKYLLSIIQKIPLSSITSYINYDVKNSTLYLLIQSFINIMETSYIRNSFSPFFLKEFSNALSIQILSITCDLHRSSLSTSHYVNLLFKILKLHYKFSDMISIPNFVILWPSLIFLLSDTNSCESQSIILEIMQEIIDTKINESDKQNINPELINIAILPLFQVIADSTQHKTRSIAMEILLNVQKLHGIQRISASNQKILKEISELSSSTFITGTLVEILSETYNLLKNFPISSDIFRIDNPKLPFAPLFHISYLFHNKENIRIQALDAIISLIDENTLLAQSKKFPIFLLLLFILRNDLSSSIHLHILHHSLPSLVSPKDPIITTKVLKFTMSLTQDKSTTRLEAIRIRVLYKLWLRQRRCWKSLRFILSDWVRNRKLQVGENTKSVSFEVEVAALTTMRDIFKTKMREYTEELVPFISNLLQSVVLHPNSLCLIIESLNLFTETEIIDPRAIWSVLMSYIADSVMKSNNLDVQLIARLCRFYQLVAQMGDDFIVDSDLYNEAKHDILSKYLCPLIFPNYLSSISNQEQDETNINDLDRFQIQSNAQILKHGLRAIAQFQAKEILSEYFPGSKILLVQLLNTNANPDIAKIEEWKLVLSKLISHEIDNMRRSLFKGVDASGGGAGSSGSESKDFLELKQRLTLIRSKIVDDWESGIVNPGLRVGFALASLLCFRPPINEEVNDKHLKSTRFYKLLANAIQDVTLTDHWIIRVGCVSKWCNFFVMGLQEVLPKTNKKGDNDVEENIVKSLIEDIMKRLNDARFPAVCQNSILAITGLCLALKSFNIMSLQHHATIIIRHLLDNFFVDAASVSKQNQDKTNDEVQFSVMMALGHLSTLVMTDEKLVSEIIDNLVMKLSEVDESAMSGWTLFGAGFSLGVFLSHLASSPIKISNVCSQTITFLADFLSSPLLSYNQTNTPQINPAFGVLLGLSNIDREEEEKAEQIYQKCLSDLKEFVNSGGKIDENIKSTIAGSAWFVGFSRGKGSDEEIFEIVDIFEKAIKIADTEYEWTGYYFHFSQVYSHILLSVLSIKESSRCLSAFNSQVRLQIDVLTSSNANMTKRHAAIITLGSLFGVKFFSFSQTTNSFFLNSSFLTMMIQVVDILQNIAGLGQQSMSDVKGGRLATVVLACLMQVIEKISEIGNEFIESNSSEAKDYSRLPATSYLRALFDELVEISRKGNIASLASVEFGSSIIKSFSTVNLVLPSVNWFPPLKKFNTPFFKKYNLHYQSVLLAIRHCDHSTSLIEFLLYALNGLPEILMSEDDGFNDMGYGKLLVGEGLGKVLELCGFEDKKVNKGDQVITKLIQKRGMEKIMKKLGNPKIEELQINFLTTMNDYLTTTNMSNASSAAITLQQDLLALLKSAYNAIPSPTSQTQAYVIRLAVQICSNIDDFSTISLPPPKNNDELGKYALTISTMSELGRIDATKYFTQLLEKCLSTFGIISEDSQSVMTPSLSFSWILRAIHVHIYKFNNKIEKKVKLDWLIRILDVLIVVASIPQKDKLVREYSGRLNQFNDLSTSKSYELWDEKFENVMQNAVNIKTISSLILREFTNPSEAKDNGIESVQKQIIKRLSKLLDMSREFSITEFKHHFVLYSILTGLKEYIPNDEILNLLDDDSFSYDTILKKLVI
ncbi:unnamed protein product [Rhizophagus irregularis]|uniref:DUF3730 domain-containing protein n=1 Tax=Rhizophagus irregularis TaxID=588596 RepID=A0A915ZG51_9GLOM|nr:unnamed protein product [Rhizophagus irregularis]